MSKPAIETVSHCDNKCLFCPYQHKDIDRGFMDWDLFVKLVDELAPQSEAIMLFNRGEPFLHPRIYDMIEYANAKVPVVLSTNAIALDVEKLFQVFKRGTLCVSCPAGERETYKELTGNDKFDLVAEKIKKIRSHITPAIEFYVKMVRQPQNEGQEAVLGQLGANVAIVDDSNQPNTKGYTTCSQPDEVPTWDFTGKRKVCCRDEYSKYNFEDYAEQGRKRQLDICQRCNIC